MKDINLKTVGASVGISLIITIGLIWASNNVDPIEDTIG